ncbi:helix-turn-helix domain-containing protein [Mucilaginibacter litoreus]|uniref:Helix-turn-helix domain-containing protein n=1 Tax=Mucilaginibacter litoreus TaxID=1048221 RepID=A0ABW3AQY2_9SPHI
MKFKVNDHKNGGMLSMWIDEPAFDRQFYTRDREHRYLTIALNKGYGQTITIDEVPYYLPANTIVPLMVNQSFYFERPADIVAWQFNREFYCIVDHDEEVSCVGFIFYGLDKQLFIELDEAAQTKLNLLTEIFIEEFNTADNIQVDMLRMLLKRLIIIITRLAKAQHISAVAAQDDRFHVIRKFNLLVENNYRTQHTVGYYAGELNKSPKTLSNLFALYNHKSPLAIIQDRIILEAKRLLIYTEKSAKEITFELGFEDAAYFSNLFKKHTGFSPTEFRQNKVLAEAGK